MNSQYMKVNPNELVIDLPVDEAKVTELMESIKVYGLLQPIVIWLMGMRIIDGFHRAVACQRLGLTEVDCIVVDCDEEAFWDARIIAAKPHAKVSNDRLAAWIFESWKQSEFYEAIDAKSIQDEYARFGVKFIDNMSTDDLVKFDVSRKLWDQNYTVFDSFDHIFHSGSPADVREWFLDKASKWGINHFELKEILLTVWGHKDAVKTWTGKQLLDRGFSLAETEAVIKFENVSNLKGGLRENLPDWAEYVKLSGDKSKSIEAFTYESNSKENERRKQKEEQERQYYQTPAGQEELRKRRYAYIEQTLDSIFNSLSVLNIGEFPESLRRLTSLISAIENKMEEAFPEHVKPTKVNPIIVENIELRRQLQEQQRKIESLERALNSKQSVTKGLSQAAALSSAEIELMTN